MSSVSTILLLAFLANTFLLYFVFSKRHTRPVHFAFAGYVLSVSLWILTSFLISYLVGKDAIEILGRLAFAVSGIVGFLYLYFSWFFPEESHPTPAAKTVIFTAIVSLLIAVICLTRLVQHGVVASANGIFLPEFGPLHPLFVGYMLTVFAWGTFNLLHSRHKTPSGHERMQVTYSLFGFILSFFPAFVANFVLPYFTKRSDYYLLGAASPLVWVGFTFYAIFRHRLLDIGIALRTLLVFLGTTFILCLAFLALFGVHLYFGTNVPRSAYWLVAVVLSMILAAVIQPLREHMTRQVDRYIFLNRYDHRQALISFNDGLGRTFGRLGIAGFTAEQVAIIFQAESGAVYLPGAGDGDLRLGASRGETRTGLPPRLPEDHPVIRLARRYNGAILREELLYGPGSAAADLREAAGLLEDSRAALAAVLESRGRLLGLLLLGPRLNENAYTTADLKLLHSLTGQAAVALDNARLYDAMVESRRHYEAILQHMQRGVLTVDTGLRIVMLNRAASFLLDVDPTRWKNRPVAQLAPDFEVPLRGALEREGTHAMEEITVRIKDRTVPFGYEVSRLQNAAGRISGALIVFEDLTERKRLDAEVRRMDRLASAGTLAAGLAHEIKNPLVSIHTFAQLLPERGAEPEFRAEFTRVVTGEVDRINHMVQNLLHLAHPRGARSGCVDMCAVLKDAFVLLERQFEKQNVEVRRRIQCTDAAVRGDREQLYQVLLNLFQNALEALSGQTTRILRVSVEKGVEWLGKESKQVVVVRVADSGPGIEPKHLSHIFDPFYTTKPSGHGLGLSICHGIIRDHGGIIQARGHPGQGTEFTVTLPLFDRAAPPETTDGPRVDNSGA